MVQETHNPVWEALAGPEAALYDVILEKEKHCVTLNMNMSSSLTLIIDLKYIHLYEL